MARRALPMKQRQGHREAVAETLLWLGHALTGLGDIEEAMDVYRASLTIREDLGCRLWSKQPLRSSRVL